MAETIGVLILTAAGAGSAGGIAGLGTVAGTTIAGISLATVVGTTAIIGASIGLNYALAKKDIPKPEDGSQALKQGIPPRIRGYGNNRLAGYYMLYEEINYDSFDVIAFHSGRIGAVLGYYLHDDVVSVSGGVVQNTYADGRYGAAKIAIETRLGEESQSAPGFISVGGVSSVWTADHTGNGTAWLSMSCGGVADVPNFTKIYPHGHPEPSVVAACSVVWDPRDVLQDRDDESTWQVSYNPVIQLLDYLTRSDGGMGLDYTTAIEPNLVQWMAEADKCDVLVATVEGSERRYECSGWFQFDNPPETIINSILATCDGWMAEAGDGTIAIRVGVYAAPTESPLTEKHIMGFSLNYGQADEQLVNQLDITFTDPGSKYVQVQTEPWQDEDSISLSGIVRAQPLDLKWVQSNSQARRLAGRAMERVNPLMTGSFVTTLYGLRYLGKRWIPLQYPFVSGLQDCVIEVQGAEVDLMAGRINWTFIRIRPDFIEAYDPDTDEGSAPVVPDPVPELALLREDGSQYIREDDDIVIRETT